MSIPNEAGLCISDETIDALGEVKMATAKVLAIILKMEEALGSPGKPRQLHMARSHLNAIKGELYQWAMEVGA